MGACQNWGLFLKYEASIGSPLSRDLSSADGRSQPHCGDSSRPLNLAYARRCMGRFHIDRRVCCVDYTTILILKRYIDVERLWEQHLTEVGNLLSFMVSPHHTRYMSCIPIYLRDMRALSTEHPEVHEKFMHRVFTLHCSKGRYNGVWSDMTLEQTYNRAGKT